MCTIWMGKTHVLECSSSIVMRPQPRTMMAQETHMMGLHEPVREVI